MSGQWLLATAAVVTAAAVGAAAGVLVLDPPQPRVTHGAEASA